MGIVRPKKTIAGSELGVVVLAAGLGTRMNSNEPKVLHTLLSKPMIHFALEAAMGLNPARTVVVVGSGHEAVKRSLGEHSYKGIRFSRQRKQLGTGHALKSSLQALKGFGGGTVLVINGDSPLVRTATLKKLITLHKRHGNSLSIASFVAHGPNSYGQIVRDKTGEVTAILEGSHTAGTEVNSGIYALEAPALALIPEIKVNRDKGEYYLTDILSAAVKRGVKSGVFRIGSEEEFMGVNTRQELMRAQEYLRRRIIAAHIDKGVDFFDTSSVYIEPTVRIGKGTMIYPNVSIQGRSTVGRDCTIYSNVRITDCVLGDSVTVKDFTVAEGAKFGKGSEAGPFTHIRPGSDIGRSAKVGNFVEMKNSSLGEGSKAMHLSYIGDSTVGRKVNIGAGTITCNYDGLGKHRTVIEDGVFVGSDTQFVAPVTAGKNSTIGAGTTVTRDVPPGALAMSRTPQHNIEGWKKKGRTARKPKKGPAAPSTPPAPPAPPAPPSGKKR